MPFKEEPSVEIFNEDFKRLYDSSPPVDLEPRETLGMISHKMSIIIIFGHKY